MLTIPITIADTETDSDLYDVASRLGTAQELEDYVIAGVITPAGLEATAISILFGTASNAPKLFKDGAGAEVSWTVAADEFVRIRPSDAPFLPPYVGISLGTAVSNKAGRTLHLILAKR